MPVYGGDIDVPNVSLHELIWKRLLEYGDATALIDSSRIGKSITFKEMHDQSKKCAAYLQSQGVNKGDFVAICVPSCIEWSFMMLGILGCGATIAPCNPSYKKGEILQQFKLSKPRMAFVAQEALETMKNVQTELECLERLFVVGESSEFTTLDRILAEGDAGKYKTVEINPGEDIAIAPHSSGTTGLPKSVMMTHRNYVAMAVLGDITKTSPGSISSYMDRPMYHTGGFGAVLAYAAAGMTGVFEQEFKVEKMLKAIETYKVASAVCVPPGLIELMNADETEKYDLSSFRAIACGGAALAPDVVQRIMKKYSVVFVPVYGMTEAGSIAMGLIPGVDYSCSGKVRSGVELKIADPKTGSECPTGENGEILVRGPQITKGYLKNPEANAKAFDKDGWFRTGDIGHLDENDLLYVVDRLKEVIKYKTVQVSPAELESVIIRHPKVKDVGVIGIPDELCGEVPKAFVVSNDQSLTEEEIQSIVKDNLVEYKHLRGGVEFVESIPKSDTGKIQRNLLKKMAGY